MGKSNPRLLKHEDLNTPTSLINNKTLTSLHAAYAQRATKAGMDTITYLCGICDIVPLSMEEWYNLVREPDTKIPWESMPNEVKKEIVLSAAKELNFDNPRFMGYKEFCNTRFKFLNNKTPGRPILSLCFQH